MYVCMCVCVHMCVCVRTTYIHMYIYISVPVNSIFHCNVGDVYFFALCTILGFIGYPDCWIMVMGEKTCQFYVL